MQLTKHCYCALKSFNYFCTYFCFLQIFFSQNMLQKISWSQKTWWLRKFLKILILSCNKQRCTCTFLNIERQFNHNKHYMLYTKISQNKLHYTLCFSKIQQNLAKPSNRDHLWIKSILSIPFGLWFYYSHPLTKKDKFGSTLIKPLASALVSTPLGRST